MKKTVIVNIIIVLCITLFFVACGTQRKTLDVLLSEDPYALEVIRNSGEEIVCKDYTVYHLGGGIDDTIKATRYAEGLAETTDRFVNYQYVVRDNQSGWLYIFESVNDIPVWLKQK